MDAKEFLEKKYKGDVGNLELLIENMEEYNKENSTTHSSRKVKFKENAQDKEFTIDGIFHKWGSDYEEYESGPANYSVAIIELKDGTMKMVYPTHMKFI